MNGEEIRRREKRARELAREKGDGKAYSIDTHTHTRYTPNPHYFSHY